MTITLSAAAMLCLAIESEYMGNEERIGKLLRQFCAKRLEQEKLQSDMDSIADEIRDLMQKQEKLDDFRGAMQKRTVPLYPIKGGLKA